MKKKNYKPTEQEERVLLTFFEYDYHEWFTLTDIAEGTYWAGTLQKKGTRAETKKILDKLVTKKYMKKNARGKYKVEHKKAADALNLDRCHNCGEYILC